MATPVYYSQYDIRWANKPYTITGDKSQTIQSSGCGPTCMAMVLATWVNPAITPAQACDMAIQMGDRTASNGTEWEYYTHIDQKYPEIECKTGNLDAVLQAVKNGALAICSVSNWFNNGGGHFILLYDDAIRIHDPASRINSGKTYTKAQIAAKFNTGFIFTKLKEVVKVMTYEDAVKKCVEKGLINSPDYWLQACKVVKSLDALFVKIAAYAEGRDSNAG